MKSPADIVDGIHSFYIGAWLIQPALNSLQQEEEVRIPPKVMHVLCLLARNRGHVVTREQFMEEVWAEEVVGEEALTHAISFLRKTFGDTPKTPQYIQTIPKSGYRLLAEVRVAREEVEAETSREEVEKQGLGNQRRGRVAVFAFGMVIIVILGIMWLVQSEVFEASPLPPSTPLRAVPFTSMPGTEYAPVFSPDGTQIAFVQGTNIHTRLIGAETVLQLTDSEAYDRNPVWSPDGQFIAFARSSGGVCGLYLVSALGGNERKLIDCDENNSSPELTWHPEGGWLAFTDTANMLGQETIRLVSISTRQHLSVTTLPEDGHYAGDSSPVFSPDGSKLAFVREGLGTMTLYVQALSLPINEQQGDAGTMASQQVDVSNIVSEAPEPVIELTSAIQGITWAPDGKDIIYAASEFGRSTLWCVSVDEGVPAWLGVENTQAIQPTLSPQGDRLAFVQEQASQNIWQAVFSADGTLLEKPHPLITSTQIDLNPQFSPDGERIAFASSRTGHGEIWVANREGENTFQVTDLGQFITFLPAWSPDGRQLSFSTLKGGHLDVYSVDVETRLWQRLTDTPSQDGGGRWSPDGEWLYFSSDRNGTMQTWRKPAAGGEAELVVPGTTLSPMISADGATVYYSKVDTPGIWRRPVEGGDEIQVVADLDPGDWNNWVLHEEGLYYMARRERGYPALSFYSLAQQQHQDLMKLPHPMREVAGLSVFADGTETRILFTLVDAIEADIMLVEDFD